VPLDADAERCLATGILVVMADAKAPPRTMKKRITPDLELSLYLCIVVNSGTVPHDG
jgi:hypothetical protein